MSLLAKAALGGLAGYAYGGDIGSAVGGAGAAAMGFGALSAMGSKAGLAGRAGGLLGKASRFGMTDRAALGAIVGKGGKNLTNIAALSAAKNTSAYGTWLAQKGSGSVLRSHMGNLLAPGRKLLANEGVRGNLNTAAQWLGNNSVRANKYAGYALGAMGVAAGAQIGSSVISSNRGL